jgi:biotin operon repressor
MYRGAMAKVALLSQREQLIVLEIDHDAIDSASSFVDYISDEYGISKSSVWYNLNCLKEEGVIDFADKQH